LAIVLGIQFIRDVACRSSASGKGSHQDSVGELKRAKLKGGEKRGHSSESKR
jgi:hypothetical protein